MPRFVIAFVVALWSLTASAKMAGVPNELRRSFKSAGHFKEVEYKIDGQTVKARLSPAQKQPVLIYQIPKEISEAQILSRFVYSRLPDTELKPAVSDNPRQRMLQLFLKDVPVENAWVKSQDTQDDSGTAYALSLPDNTEVVGFLVRNGNEKLSLHNGRIYESREVKRDGRLFVQFPEASALPERQVVKLKAKKAPLGKVDKFMVDKGTFPDQIAVDENDHLWFTQPNDSFLTRFDPVKNEWEHITVGSGADGLFLGKNKRFWFGEYYVGHLGMYDAVKKEYKRWAPPYAKPVPAIPFEDEFGQIWLSDHENNKISWFDPSKENWKVYDVPSAGAWAVQILKEPRSAAIYITECYANKIGKIEPVVGAFTEIELGVSGCPAFMAEREGLLWIGQWSAGSFLSLDVKTGQVTEYQVEVEDGGLAESGIGPTGRDTQGRIYFGSVMSGHVYRFDPATQELLSVDGIGGLKDGLIVDSKNQLWVTEMAGSLTRVVFE